MSIDFSNLSGLKDALHKERSSRSLKPFIQYAWPILEPSRPFQDNWHIGAVSAHLEAVTAGEVNRLLILVSPGFMKSLTVSVFWPAWVWGPKEQPFKRWMITSYAQHLSDRDAIRCRNIIRSSWYQRLWGDQVQMSADRDQVRIYQNEASGFRLATSVGGVGTGERGDFVIGDDLHNILETESDSQRAEVIRYWSEVIPSRMTDPKGTAFVVVMQRAHAHDIAGHIMEMGGYEVLRLPMEFESKYRCYTKVKPKDIDKSSLDPTLRARKRKDTDDIEYCWDPRTEDNELAWPSRYPRYVVDRLKKELGAYAYATQYQMHASPREGGLIKLHQFQRYTIPPAIETITSLVQSWDTADKGGQQNAYSVCSTWAQTGRGHYLLHVLRDRWAIPELKNKAKSQALWCQSKYGQLPSAILIEDKASGVGLIQYLRLETNYPIIAIQPQHDKVTRMDIETPAIEAGTVWLPEVADWLPDFETEARDFPNTSFMDQVDSMSQYLHWVRIRASVRWRPLGLDDDEDTVPPSPDEIFIPMNMR